MPPSPLEVAVRAAVAGDLRLIKEMATTMDLRRGMGRNGRNMLHFSATAGVLDFCRFLVEEAGFHPNSVSAEGETPIFTATEADGGGAAIVSVVRYLIERGGDPAKPDAKGCTPLHKAAEFGHVEVVRLLLSKGVPVDPIERRGTPLHLAAVTDNHQSLKLLLDHGADPNRVVTRIFSPLLMACIGHSFKCLKLLVEAGADVNFAGADPNIPDGNGRLPIMLAATREKRELVEILLPQTKPIPFVPDWSVDGIIRAMKLIQSSEPRELVEKRLADAKAQGKEAFADGHYVAAAYYYMRAKEIDPNDATVFSNLSLCWLRLREGEQALAYARQCKALRPDWSKAWYREGMALSFLENYEGAVNALHEALKLDPASNEIKEALREAVEVHLNSLLDGEDP
ncbi:serine/threonine-protein phosphatase 6 regulatory ankyrin repeat subunit B [Sorghum bicolor]|uniref:serine/threonine-protein phosphatase 6 regulatory ankyrin repeat subunit B n=1 Tax=Sorghum bicolor TaxID=4558 RepID=UPI000B4263C2|nr:serine/threonine-protein phosphatase 6 regulatory ankyrin repeat subunit B [Sorghum bicolor]|eukprot:XP_021302360.1 serine/threonine-protein phosphatase 6 regulatory ankyrin repeat subunit B [Sorghum bicolor]